MSIGIWQILLILVIVFVIFGAGKLPRVMGDLGRGIRSMREGLKSDEEQGDSKQESPKQLHQDTPGTTVEVEHDKDRKQ